MYEEVLDKARCPYRIRPLPFAACRDFVREHHYSRGCANTMVAGYGLFERLRLIGACMFAVPCSEAVRRSVFGPGHEAGVVELHRLVILDVTPRNTESFFVAHCLRILKRGVPRVCGVLSFADPSHGHVGLIYQATNSLYSGLSKGGEVRYIDGSGRLRHRRQCGRNVSLREAAERGWTVLRGGPKHRYVFLLPGGNSFSVRRAERERLRELYRLGDIPYPRPPATANGGKI